MTRADILSHALFDTGGEINEVKFGPISQPCLVILKRRKNRFLADSSRDQDDHEAIGEVLFVISRTKEQRAAMFRDSAEEWDLKVGEFMAGLDDDTLPTFRDEYMAPAFHSLAMAMVESETPGKPQRTRQTSPTSSKVQGGPVSTILPEPSERKILSGMSQPALSSKSSTRKQAGTGHVSAGSTGRKQAKKASTSLKGSRVKK